MTTPPSSRPDCTQTQVKRVRGGAIAPAPETDFVAEETPVALEFNGISHATMLATPADLEDFAVGFALSEGIIDSVSDVRGIDLLPQCDWAAAGTVHVRADQGQHAMDLEACKRCRGEDSRRPRRQGQWWRQEPVQRALAMA